MINLFIYIFLIGAVIWLFILIIQAIIFFIKKKQ